MGKRSKGKRSSRRTKGPTRPRTEAAYFRTKPNTSRIELTVDVSSGRVSAGTDCKVAYTEVSYSRENSAKGDKTVSRVFASDHEPTLDLDDSLGRFDFCVAIDTNTIDVDGRRRSVIGIVIGDREVFGTPYCIEVADLPIGMEERVGWTIALNHLCADGFLKPDDAVGVFVDAHLGDLEEINSGNQGLIPDHPLPAAWTLNYASADSGADLEANRLFRHADKVATQILNKLQAERYPLPEGPELGAIVGMKRVIRGLNAFDTWAELYAELGRKYVR